MKKLFAILAFTMCLANAPTAEAGSICVRNLTKRVIDVKIVWHKYKRVYIRGKHGDISRKKLIAVAKECEVIFGLASKKHHLWKCRKGFEALVRPMMRGNEKAWYQAKFKRGIKKKKCIKNNSLVVRPGRRPGTFIVKQGLR